MQLPKKKVVKREESPKRMDLKLRPKK